MPAMLTPAGKRYAEGRPESVVARVALQGYDAGWPTAHVTTAINVCNEKAVHPKDRKRWADGTDHGDNDQR